MLRLGILVEFGTLIKVEIAKPYQSNFNPLSCSQFPWNFSQYYSVAMTIQDFAKSRN